MITNTYTLITGASGGIGFDLAQLAAAGGHNLILVARSAEKLSRLAADISTKYKSDVVTFAVDLSDKAGVDKLIAEIEGRKLSVDTLVNNAGFGDFGDFARADLDKNLEMIRLNISALTQLTHAFMRGMIGSGKGRGRNAFSGPLGSSIACSVTKPEWMHNSVCPSGRASAAARAAIRPPAPARLSTRKR